MCVNISPVKNCTIWYWYDRMQRRQKHKSWGVAWLLGHATDCSIRVVTVLLEYFEHILTYFWRGSVPAFLKLGALAL